MEKQHLKEEEDYKNYYKIYYTYDLNYETGNCPKGIFEFSGKYNSLDKTIEHFIILMKKRKVIADFEYAWNKEYRLAIIKNDKEIIKTDYQDNFWNNLFQKKN